MDIIKQILNSNDVNMIVYHGGCSDGFAAALCGYLVKGDQIDYYEGKFTNNREDDHLIDYLKGKREVNLVILDFSYSKSFMLKLKEICQKVILLDHHITAQNELKEFEWCYFDQDRSGCTIGWEYFMGNTEYPELLKLIEDRDLWRWTYPNNKEFTSAFYNLVPFDFNEYGSFIDNSEKINQYIDKGKTILEYIESENRKHAKSVYRVKTATKTIGFLNLINNISEFGNYITNNDDIDFAVLWFYDHSTQTIKGSLRSAKGSSNDCSQLAKALGGGGHFNAAGFVWKGDIESLINKVRELLS